MKKVTYTINRRNLYEVIKPSKKQIKLIEEKRDEKRKGRLSPEEKEVMKMKEEKKKCRQQKNMTKLYQA